jgi:uncharacterized phage-associated protein
MSNNWKFPFNEQKAIQALGLLLSLADEQKLSKVAALSLLYLIERSSLVYYDSEILGDNFAVMKYGIIPSTVYDSLKQRKWSEFFTTDWQNVKLIRSPKDDDLCQADREIIKDVFEEFGNLDPFRIADFTKNLPEYTQVHDTSRELTLETILWAIGRTPEQIEEIKSVAMREVYLDSVLNA